MSQDKILKSRKIGRFTITEIETIKQQQSPKTRRIGRFTIMDVNSNVDKNNKSKKPYLKLYKPPPSPSASSSPLLKMRRSGRFSLKRNNKSSIKNNKTQLHSNVIINNATETNNRTTSNTSELQTLLSSIDPKLNPKKTGRFIVYDIPITKQDTVRKIGRFTIMDVNSTPNK
jgi:hypothetical protein